MNLSLRKVLTLSVPASCVTLVLFALSVEAWVRLSWDPLRGTPGLFVADARRIERLAPNYAGWLGGVPVRINNLGFRDSRDYRLEKGPGTFRIVVLGDSVTFGHGSLYENTYPYLLEQKLKAWKPDIEWEVWNLGVPGYNTAQELDYLEEVGASYQADLVVIGFYENDIFDNGSVRTATRGRLITTRIKQFLKSHFYSFEFYKRVYLQLSWKLTASDAYRQLFENLAREEEMLARVDKVQDLQEQTPTAFERLDRRESMTSQCELSTRPDVKLLNGLKQNSGWSASVRALQELHRQEKYRIVFFVNMAPEACKADDLFYYGRSKVVHDYVLETLSIGTQAASAYEAFYRTRPSQMPVAGGHSIGNSNVVKAETLFRFVTGYLSTQFPAFKPVSSRREDRGPRALVAKDGAS